MATWQMAMAQYVAMIGNGPDTGLQYTFNKKGLKRPLTAKRIFYIHTIMIFAEASLPFCSENVSDLKSQV